MDFLQVIAVLNLPIVGAILAYVVRIEARLVRLETIHEVSTKEELK